MQIIPSLFGFVKRIIETSNGAPNQDKSKTFPFIFY